LINICLKKILVFSKPDILLLFLIINGTKKENIFFLLKIKKREIK